MPILNDSLKCFLASGVHSELSGGLLCIEQEQQSQREASPPEQLFDPREGVTWKGDPVHGYQATTR